MAATPRLTRAVEVGLELRGGDGRTVTGIAAPFDSPTEITEDGRTFTETIQRGAFSRRSPSVATG